MSRTIHTDLRITRAQIAKKLKEFGIEPTKERVDGIADHLRSIAQAWASAELQDLTQEDAEYYTSDKWLNGEVE